MGTEPENIENLLRGRKTLPGLEPNRAPKKPEKDEANDAQKGARKTRR